MTATAIEKQVQVRTLKAQGFTYREIAEQLGMTPQMAMYYGKPAPQEHLCSQCCQPLKKAK